MYCEYDPCIVYGVKEPRRGDRYISDDFLQAFDPKLSQYATNVVRGYAADFIYGCTVSVKDIVSNKRTKEMKLVDHFAKKYDLGKPKFRPALSGDYEYDATSYCPVESHKKELHKEKRRNKNVEHSDNKTRVSGKENQTKKSYKKEDRRQKDTDSSNDGEGVSREVKNSVVNDRQCVENEMHPDE